jgi:hypothetical protein
MLAPWVAAPASPAMPARLNLVFAKRTAPNFAQLERAAD